MIFVGLLVLFLGSFMFLDVFVWFLVVFHGEYGNSRNECFFRNISYIRGEGGSVFLNFM